MGGFLFLTNTLFWIRIQATQGGHMNSGTVVKIDIDTLKLTTIEGVNMQSLHDYMVMAYNNDLTDGRDVVEVFMKECGYPEEKAIAFTYKVHSNGSAVVFWSKKDSCEKLVQALARILVKSEVLKNE
jgi:ATP-dependent Clp protease adapter protein ClpS